MPQTPVSLSTADFHARVHDLAPRVAVFDCDGTLWSGDAGSAFMRWTMETAVLSSAEARWMNTRYEAYKRGEVSELAICGEMVQVYKGHSVDAMRAVALEFFHTHVQRNIFPELAALIAQLQSGGTDIWAVSSTNDWVIEEGVRHFNIPANRVLAARVQTKRGLVTDTLIDVPTDEGKVVALRNAGITAPDAVFGNSIHDAAMLAIARRAFPVNPSPALAQRAAAEGWPVFYPAAVKAGSKPSE